MRDLQYNSGITTICNEPILVEVWWQSLQRATSLLNNCGSPYDAAAIIQRERHFIQYDQG